MMYSGMNEKLVVAIAVLLISFASLVSCSSPTSLSFSGDKPAICHARSAATTTTTTNTNTCNNERVLFGVTTITSIPTALFVRGGSIQEVS
jgi:hypothetical protein